MDEFRNQLDLVWLAGFFDGEGCISLMENRGYVRGEVSLSQKDPMPLHRVLHIAHEQGWPRPYVGYAKGGVKIKWYDTHGCKPLESLLPYLCPRNSERAGIYLRAFLPDSHQRSRTGIPTQMMVARKKALKQHELVMSAHRYLDSRSSWTSLKDEVDMLWRK